ncbi:hypothetical protein NDU88_004731 [Pleurodeles waltl]|uniref:Uncharacterized protein n=1 Tax=Pleurodeles waltl TaxID=8319 RepID=A0AAV7NKM3_PLEWA|nr:hypothetical protein NDU88_004731 [Pleurodeles waltl]
MASEYRRTSGIKGGAGRMLRGNEKRHKKWRTAEKRRSGDSILRSGAGGRDEERSWIPGGEMWNDVTETAAVQEAQCKDTSHASGEAWYTQVRPGTI